MRFNSLAWALSGKYLADCTIDSSNAVCFVDSYALFPLLSFALLDEGVKLAYICELCLHKC